MSNRPNFQLHVMVIKIFNKFQKWHVIHITFQLHTDDCKYEQERCPLSIVPYTSNSTKV